MRIIISENYAVDVFDPTLFALIHRGDIFVRPLNDSFWVAHLDYSKKYLVWYHSSRGIRGMPDKYFLARKYKTIL